MKFNSKAETKEDVELTIFKIKSLLGVIILAIIAFFVLLLNFLIIPFDLARKPIRDFIYKHRKTPA